MAWLKHISILIGLAFLVGSLRPIATIMEALPPGRLRRSWNLLSILVFGFIVGYCAIGLLGIGRPVTGADLVMSAILLSGGLFVLLVARLSALTAWDLRQVERLEGEAMRDALTGLFNRRHMEGALARELAHARRHARPLSLLLIDLDHFKRINDTRGHLTGDMVLRHTAGLLSRTVRSVDIAVRYGGEEFLLIAPGCDGVEAREIGERILDAFRSNPALLPGGEALAVTASIGTAEFDPSGTAEDLLSRADRALYEAKRQGRDRLVALPDGRGMAA